MKDIQRQSEQRSAMISFKRIGLALLFAASAFLPLESVYEVLPDAAAAPQTTPQAIVFADIDNNQGIELPAYVDETQYETMDGEPAAVAPLDYQVSCFKSKKWYSYDLLTQDITSTLQNYQSLVSYEVIGKSVQGRDIYALNVGHGPVHVLITAGVHARENANTPMIMQCLFDYLKAGASGDSPKLAILDEVTLIIVPLVNPDGYQYCIKKKNGKKKTNYSNVDINRNFPCKYWGSRIKKRGNFYPGPNPGSEPETQAIMALFDRYDFALAVDIHSRAREIICQKGGYTPEDIKNNEDPGKLNEISLAIAQQLLAEIRYKRVDELKVKMGEEGTLTDYAFSKGVPTITFETLRYKNNRLADPKEIRQEYGFFNWPNTLYKIADFARSIN